MSVASRRRPPVVVLDPPKPPEYGWWTQGEIPLDNPNPLANKQEDLYQGGVKGLPELWLHLTVDGDYRTLASRRLQWGWIACAWNQIGYHVHREKLRLPNDSAAQMPHMLDWRYEQERLDAWFAGWRGTPEAFLAEAVKEPWLAAPLLTWYGPMLVGKTKSPMELISLAEVAEREAYRDSYPPHQWNIPRSLVKWQDERD